MKDKQKQLRIEVPKHGIISRPIEVFNSLPIEYRWEYSRRHPYYLLFWEMAHKHWRDPCTSGGEKLIGEAAILILRLIGVVSDPPPPGTTFEEIDDSAPSSPWRQGAISVITFRGLVGAMIKELPRDSRAAIGDFFIKSASGAEDETPLLYKAISDLVAFKDPSLDKTPVAPIIGINVHAPVQTIVQNVESITKSWKAQLGITEHRRRDDKLPAYLEVWDLREGWAGNGYDRHKEKTFAQIVADLGEPITTVVNRYRSAFRYITGHEYRPDLWARLFGMFKTSEIVSSQVPNRTLLRPWKSPKKREVPETVVAPKRPTDHRGSFLENMAIVQDMRRSSELIMDVQTLLDKGYDSQRIAEELEIAVPEAIDIIEYLRQRHDEGI